MRGHGCAICLNSSNALHSCLRNIELSSTFCGCHRKESISYHGDFIDDENLRRRACVARIRIACQLRYRVINHAARDRDYEIILARDSYIVSHSRFSIP